jgi:hypothetical protein
VHSKFYFVPGLDVLQKMEFEIEMIFDFKVEEPRKNKNPAILVPPL